MGSTDTSLRIVKIKNLFDRRTRETNDYPYNGQTLQRLVDVFLPADIEFRVSINGQIIERENWPLTKAKAGDYIIFVPVVGDLGGGGDDDGGKAILGAILMIAVIFAAPMAAGWLGLKAGTLAYAFGSAAIVAAGGILINALMPRPQRKLSEPMLGVSEISQISQVYGWSPQTTQRQGLVVPKFYGKNRIYGNVIAAHTEVGEGDDTQLLKILIALSGYGPVKSISDIRLNDQPAANYEDVTTEQRLGLIDQDVISFFTETKPEYRPTIKINNASPRTYETPDDDFDDLEVDLHFPRGIFYANDAGGLSSHSVGIKIEVSIHDDNDWTAIAEETVTKNTTGRLWKSYKASDSMAITNGEKYDIKVTKTTADQTSTRYGDDVYLCGVREVINDEFTYPSTALVGISALATDQLSGSMRFSCLMEGAVVLVYDGEAWTIEYSNNPAWVLYDILVQPIISGDGNGTPYDIERYDGIHPSRIDTAKFYELAVFCDQADIPDGKGGTEKRITFNGGVDIASTMWESALKVAEVARCVPLWIGTTLTLAIDKPSDPVQMFTVGNIVENSFKETFLPEKDLASEIEIRYRDEDQDFKLTPFTIFNTAIPNAANKVTLELFGITKQSEAWRAGMLRLAQNQLLKRTQELVVDIDAIACTVGERVLIQHDVPNWGRIGSGGQAYNAGGRIVSTDLEGANHKVMIDCDLQDALAPGTTYEIMIRLSDDTIETKTITSIVENVVTISGTFTGTPAKDDVWAIGEQNLVAKIHTIINLERAGDQRCKITAIEYDADVYAHDAASPVLPAPLVTPPEADGDITKPPSWHDIAAKFPTTVFDVLTMDFPVTTNIEWGSDDPEAGDVSWSAEVGEDPMLLTYRGTTHEITASHTEKKYIYWDLAAPTIFQGSDTLAAAVGVHKWVMCLNDEGTAFMAPAAQKIFHAGLVQASTVDTEHIKAGAITAASGIIADLAVENAKIGNLAVDTAQIASLAVEAAKIADAAIENAKIDNLAVGTEKIAALAVETAKVDDDAIHIEGIGSTSGSILLTQGSETEVEDCVITSAGGIILIAGTCIIDNNSVVNTTAMLKLYYGSELLDYKSIQVDAGEEGGGGVAAIAAPGSGAKTYDLKVSIGGVSPVYAKKRHIRAEETRGK